MSTNPPTQVQTFALSMFTNAVQNVTGQDLALRASKQISQALENAASTIGQWQLVWGPGVLVGKDGYSVNTMYVSQSVADPSQYVISIGGTNFNSPIDTLIEDLHVYKQVPWLFNIGAIGAKIALGTAIGLLNLQNLRPAPRLPGEGTTLVDFLRTIVSNKVHITVAGHSLGGALAPTVALWLADTAQGLVLPWDPGKNATIGAQSFAGPTAGNGEFAFYSGARLGALLQPAYNTLDLVPHAWAEFGTPSLFEMWKIYEPNIAPPVLPKVDLSYAAIVVLVEVFRLLAMGGGYTTLPNLKPVTGSYTTDAYKSSTLDSLQKFLAQGAYQHIEGYYAPFGYDPNWMPASPPEPVILSPELAALAQSSSSANDFVAALQQRPTRQIQVGDVVVDAPKGPNDPQADRVAAIVQAAFAKQAGVNPPA
ncbi:hypothetical protein OV203_40395 [Nannocystis sp. ILAH1]|uniref:lipase family protein n=1 Tax=unclassified Nannocystis TaxID=2627009 RepID=UPI00226FB50D|nr:MULTISPECIES: hypothetical protein [unclassified Nannocystis]MCY0993468.1 hypothetical protein [Nannocystis sp. ILAH1]MCY1063804.1 hypothetical protein [Nannocystis sp. RBIL2]